MPRGIIAGPRVVCQDARMHASFFVWDDPESMPRPCAVHDRRCHERGLYYICDTGCAWDVVIGATAPSPAPPPFRERGPEPELSPSGARRYRDRTISPSPSVSWGRVAERSKAGRGQAVPWPPPPPQPLPPAGRGACRRSRRTPTVNLFGSSLPHRRRGSVPTSSPQAV